jgi:glycosyltransferase involved in cell wall biosynthesis
MKLSVVIPCYARHELSIRHVEECLKSYRLPDEIIIINDGGDPSLREMLLEKVIYNKKRLTDIIYARIDQDILWNYNGACNLGVWLSTGDIIALEDTDHIPARGLYELGMMTLDSRPEIDRIGVRRAVVNINDVMTKPMEEWTAIKGWGSNQMVTLFRRDMYLKLKGQDERFAGNYGWMAYDWPMRYKRAGIQTATISGYWAVVGDDGEPGLKRGLSVENRRIYRSNANSGSYQHPEGILKFTYTYERF